MIDSTRKLTRSITVGNVGIGGEFPISVQSMATIPTEKLDLLFKEIDSLQDAGCQIVRITIPNINAARKIPEIKKHAKVPIVADIHFNHKLALMAMDSGIDKVRINPGNIGSHDNVREVLKKAAKLNIPIRIGINSGSLEKLILKKYGHPTAEAMVESAESHIRICQDFGFHNLAVSLKSSNTLLMIQANRLFSDKYDYPLHLGVTEAGPVRQGTIKSSVGIGTLLSEGIGDTIRVSLTGSPVEEIKVANSILKSLHLIEKGVTIVSCPTCGRTSVNIERIATKIEKLTENINKKATIAVMGCVVNGPGEARESDIGVACSDKQGVIFRNGKIIDKIPENKIIDRLLSELEKL